MLSYHDPTTFGLSDPILAGELWQEAFQAVMHDDPESLRQERTKISTTTSHRASNRFSRMVLILVNSD